MSSSYLVPRGVITTPSYLHQWLNIAAEVRIKLIRRHHILETIYLCLVFTQPRLTLHYLAFLPARLRAPGF